MIEYLDAGFDVLVYVTAEERDVIERLERFKPNNAVYYQTTGKPQLLGFQWRLPQVESVFHRLKLDWQVAKLVKQSAEV